MRTPTSTPRLLLLACTLAGLVVLTPARAADPPRTDAHGDPLPDGVLARLGTIRWRAGNTIAMTAFLPDGKSLLTVSQDYVAQVWERDTGKELRRFDAAGAASTDPNVARYVSLNAAGNNVVLSGDGKTLACPGRDGAVHLWEVSSGKELSKMGDWRIAGRAQLALSPDGKTLAMAMYGQKTTLYDTATTKELRSFGETTPTSRLMAYKMTFGLDGKTLAQAGLEVGNGALKTGVILWDAANGKELQRFADPAAAGAIPALLSAISPDAKLWALPSGDKVKLIDLATGKEARQLEGGDGRSSLVFSPDGKLLVALAGRNEALTVWDTATGKTVHQHGKAEAPAAGVAVNWAGRVTSSLAVSADAKLLAWSDGPAVRLVELATGKEKNASAGHAAALRDVSFGRDGKTLLTWADDATIRRWDAASGKEVGQIAVPNKSYAFVIPSPDERVLAAGDPDGTIHLLDAATGKESHALQPTPQTYGRSVAFSPDSRWLAAVSPMAQSVVVFDVSTGREKQSLALPSAQAAGAAGAPPGVWIAVGGRSMLRVFFSPDSRQVAVTDTNLVVWDVATGRDQREIALPQAAQVRCATFSPDGRTIAAEMNGGEIGVWEVASGQKRLTLNPQPNAAPSRLVERRVMMVSAAGVANGMTLAFSPDGRLLAQADDRKARLWDLHTGKDAATFDGHRGPLAALAFAPDGKRLATASTDTTGLLWDAEPVVKKLPQLAAALPKEKLESLWTTLGGGDGARAFEAIRALAGDPAQSVPFLGERVKPVKAPDPKHVAKLIADLDADDFPVRETAYKELEGLGELALAPLRTALKDSLSAEQRRALEELVKAAETLTPSGERLRLLRALEALEMARTADAVKVLKGMAAGAPDTLPTTQAQAILTRLGQK
ncbi:MAG TPA: WD40 repeat domain-containing protein [Gemmataceae bacterium]|nr:WD40 repeat domain-containing protein [Gemmataceae bacterium]